YSHWWKNVEDNSLTRPSTNSNVLNQTSRYLDSNSEMEASLTTDDWWKVLDISNSSKMNNNVVQRNSVMNVQTSESEEESVVKKRKHSLLLKGRKSKDNIFLNALNDSVSSKLKVAEKTRRRKSSMSPGRTIPNAQQSDRVEERSLDHSQSTNDILKSKPNIFRRNYKSQNRNPFIDVLKESELEPSSPRRAKSQTIVSDNEQQIERKDSIPAATKASTSNKSVANQLELTSENENDVSHFRTPKAQRTMFEDNSPSVHNSTKRSNDSAYDTILKPKSRLLANYRKNRNKNLFENALESQKDTSRVQETLLHGSSLPLQSPSRERVSTGSAQLQPTVVRTSSPQKTNVSKGQKSVRHFLKSDKMLPASQVFRDKDKVDGIKRKLDMVKKREIARMKMDENKQKNAKKSSSVVRKIDEVEEDRKPRLQKQRSTRQIHKAFLVNGQPYRVPRLPRPQYWITDRLYKYLWKCMEPRFKLETRIASEKFVHQLSNVTTLIVKRKSYSSYKAELHALMKEMARLGIIRTRNDFYNFCHDFFPYELRVRTVPMLLPGNKKNIPYNANELHEPLLASLTSVT
ncbi:unnamed protein product, partial [Heterotrigona itama]